MQGPLPYVALLPKFRVACYYSPVLVMDARPKSSLSLVKCTADPPITVRSRSPKVCETLGASSFWHPLSRCHGADYPVGI